MLKDHLLLLTNFNTNDLNFKPNIFIKNHLIRSLEYKKKINYLIILYNIFFNKNIYNHHNYNYNN